MAKALISITVLDGDGDKSAFRTYVNVEDGDTVTSLTEDFVHPLWDTLLNFLTGQFVSASIEIIPDTSEWQNTNAPQADSDIEEKAKFTFLTATRHKVILSFPTMWEGYFINDGAGKVLDPTQADVIAFGALMTNAVVDGGINATDSHGDDISIFLGGSQFFGKG